MSARHKKLARALQLKALKRSRARDREVNEARAPDDPPAPDDDAKRIEAERRRRAKMN